jgi:putative membrane protein
MIHSLVVLDVDDFGHMMGWDHMTGWWWFPFFGIWGLIVWVVQIIIAILVYKDAQKRKKNGLLWCILVSLPWIGILFLIAYLIIRGEETEKKEIYDEGQKVLDERYAKGEITREEYLQMKKDIEKKKQEP